MIPVVAHGWTQFLTVHAILRGHGVEVVASGGNDMSVPDDTAVGVLRAVAEAGAIVHADLTEPVPQEPQQTKPDPGVKAAARKSVRRRTAGKE